MSAWSDDAVADTINGLFQIQAKLGDILDELVAIRRRRAPDRDG
jgi:hypothetical protein